ncbi:DUF4192 domain-containing protein [Mycolicibacterium setense]|uniref:DUF4192 domain-containing protein n=1 Tax=Mycolicibacterium setense TaxID=431269 RepID=A0ABR4YX26_9MYCO|nr:DUF4192 domain-containing protein [Mycolicibacterium setense]KHO22292.1 hypothetical protein QQ25_14165 [Mycolicibacterium setense]KHO26729.1 hypothetical protein QQ44_10690 [Mycolicibacterium setense]MCV7114192.1 DUF4192 domain-containing protein [Mycolicibacterium setense]
MTTPPPSSSEFDFHLNRPGALIAALPAVLGFVPHRSLVLVTVDRGALGCVMRADLADDMTQRIDHLVDLAATAGADAVIAVVVDDQSTDCQACDDRYRDLTSVLDQALAADGIELYAAHVVDKVAAGGIWHCADGCGEQGFVDDPGASPLAAAAVLDGRRLYASREELLQVIRPDPVAGDGMKRPLALVAQRPGCPESRPDAEVRTDVEAAMTVALRLAEGDGPGRAELARLAVGLADPRVRDTLYALAVGECAEQAEALWALLARSLPDPWRVEALVLLAFSAYARGDGPLAGVSLDAALQARPTHRMAGMLDTALQSGMHPERIRELAATGYRLAEQLGVQLPRRRQWGRRAG